ncbi:hypothetical protein AO377_0223 [Moraxella catarrhalis]|nr:hypothetical protein AO377_0223 [Moraxella catarrhalis]
MTMLCHRHCQCDSLIKIMSKISKVSALEIFYYTFFIFELSL